MEESRVVTLNDVEGKPAVSIERIFDGGGEEGYGLVVRITQHGFRRRLIPLSEFTLAARALDPGGDSG